MEPRGRNWSQASANRPNVETAKVSENRWHGLSPFACDVPWLASTLSVLGRGSASTLHKSSIDAASPLLKRAPPVTPSLTGE